MTDRDAGHCSFGELAAGYALDALEPADERRFVAHMGRCPRCWQLVDDFRQVAGSLAETSPQAEPSGRLGDRILAAALDGGGPQDSPAGGGRAGAPGATLAAGSTSGTAQTGSSSVVVPLPGRSGRWQRRAAVAAAAVLVAGGGIWGGLAATGGSAQPPLAICARPHVCAQVVLTATGTGRAAATVIVRGGVAWMEPTAAMVANRADEIYVLWQITRARTPLAVGSFDIRPGVRRPLRIGDLAVPYGGTRVFAISLEHGRTIPARPSKPVAVGQVS